MEPSTMEIQVKTRIEDLECLLEQRELTDVESEELANLDTILYNLRNEDHP